MPGEHNVQNALAAVAVGIALDMEFDEIARALAAFRGLASAAGWELTVASGDVDDTMAFLRSPDFAAGQDAIVYNFCFADSRDLDAMRNLIAQTEEHGVPALLVHCAMHSWWDTFKKGKAIEGNELGLARANKRLLKSWAKQHPDRPLPAWGDFTGIAFGAFLGRGASGGM